MPPIPTHVMVKSAAPKGRFRRAHLDFTNETWRCFKIGTELDADPDKEPSTGAITAEAAKRHAAGVIGPDTYERLAREHTMLAVKSCTAEEVADYEKRQADGAGKSQEQLLAEVLAKNAELEARLMKVELGKQAPPATKAGKPGPEGGEK